MQPLTADDVEARLCAALEQGDSAQIERYGALLDTMCPDPTMPTLHASALWYASVGLHIFPLTPRAKTPLPRSHGCKDATDDIDQVNAWWSAVPDANIGIATGHLVDVVDVDGLIGTISWARRMYDEHDDYSGPEVIGTVSTPRPGGGHLYIRADPRFGNRTAMMPGVDYRGTGGYVVAPPSANDAGVTYSWTRPIDADTLGAIA